MCMLSFKMYFCGIVVDKPYKGFSIKVEPTNLKWFGEEYDNCIAVSYKVNDIDLRLADNETKDRITFRYLRNFLDILNLMSGKPSKLVTHTCYIHDTKYHISMPLRNAPLHIYNFPDIFQILIPNMFHNYKSYTNRSSWKILEESLKKYNDQRIFKNDKIKTSLRWYQKGCDEFSSFARLIAYWISFNTLYSDEHLQEPVAIEKYLRHKLKGKFASDFYLKHKSLFEDLTKASIFLGKKNKRNISAKLEKLMAEGNLKYEEIFIILFLIIYSVRNSLFHGGMNPDDNIAEDQVQICEYLLASAVRHIILSEFSTLNYSDYDFTVKQQANF